MQGLIGELCRASRRETDRACQGGKEGSLWFISAEESPVTSHEMLSIKLVMGLRGR